MINSKKRLLKLSVLSTILVCTACNDTDFFNEYQSVQDGWKKDNVLTFDFESLDTVKAHQSFLNIRTNNDYPYSNLFVIVKLVPPQGNATVDTLQYQMANADGTMLGSGFTDVKEHKLVWREKIKFPKKGVYKVEVSHAVRNLNEVKGDAVLKGITEVGLQVQ